MLTMNNVFNRVRNTLMTPRGLLILTSIITLGLVVVVNISISIDIILGVALVLGILITGMTLQYPSGGIALLAFITWVRFSDIIVQYHGAPSVAKLFVPFLLGIVFLRWWIYREVPTGWRDILIIMSLFAFSYTLSLLYAISYRTAYYLLSDLIKDMLIALVLVFLMKDKDSFRYVMWALVIGGIFLGTIAVVQYATGDFSNNYWGFGQAPIMQITSDAADDHRLGGPIGDPNTFAQIMLLIVPIAFDRFSNEKNPSLRLLALWGFTATVLTIVLTFSRGAFVALMIMFALMFMLRPPKISTVVATILLSIFLLPFVPAQFTERMSTITDLLPGSNSNAMNEVSFRGRTNHFFVALNMFADYPVFGVGVGQFKYYYQTYSRPLGINTGTREGKAAHNRWLQIAAEQGLLGIVLQGILLSAIYVKIRTSARVFRKAEDNSSADLAISLGIGIIGYLLAGTFLTDNYPRYFWLLIGIAFALPNAAQHTLNLYRQALPQSQAVPS